MNGYRSKQLRKDAIEDVDAFIKEKGKEALGKHSREQVIKGEYAKKKRNYRRMNWRQRTAFMQAA